VAKTCQAHAFSGKLVVTFFVQSLLTVFINVSFTFLTFKKFFPTFYIYAFKMHTCYFEFISHDNLESIQTLQTFASVKINPSGFCPAHRTFKRITPVRSTPAYAQLFMLNLLLMPMLWSCIMQRNRDARYTGIRKIPRYHHHHPLLRQNATCI